MLEYEQLDEYKNLSDNQLIKLYKEGVQSAFLQLVVRYMFVLKNKTSPFCGDIVDYEELLQEGLICFERAALSFDENGGASFSTYLSVCIHNHLVSFIRGLNSDKNIINNNTVSIDEERELCSSPEDEPENALMIKESMRSFKEYLKNNLSDMEYSVLLLYLEKNSYDEIAHKLNISRKSCDNAMNRIRAKLKIMN